jgi:transposase
LELLKKVPGISSKRVEDLVAEIDLDMSVFTTEKHLASWAGMAPGNNESAGKKKAEVPHKETSKQVKAVLTEIAWAATRTKKTFYRERY